MFLYNGRERRPDFIGAGPSRDFAHATVSGRWFQRVTVSTKKLSYYFGMFKHFELLV